MDVGTAIVIAGAIVGGAITVASIPRWIDHLSNRITKSMQELKEIAEILQDGSRDHPIIRFKDP